MLAIYTEVYKNLSEDEPCQGGSYEYLDEQAVEVIRNLVYVVAIV
jgi:hypothetical protein